MDGYGLAKIILIGEHSVVYGNKAVALPFSALRTEVVLIKSPTTNFDTKFYQGEIGDCVSQLDGLKALVETLEKTYPKIKPMTISIVSNIPEKSGLGSSASVAKAVIDAYNNHFHLKLSNEEYFSLLSVSENIYHSRASGIDASTIIYEKPIVYQNGVVKKLNINIHGYLVVFYSLTNGATKDAVIKVRNAVRRDELISKLATLTDYALDSLETNDLKTLGSIFNSAHETLRDLGVSSDSLETLRNSILSHGALGVKLTGGGMGGCVLALFDNFESAVQATKQLEKYPSWMINLSHVL